VNLDDLPPEVDVGPCQREGFGDLRAGTDQEHGQRAVRLRAGGEVVLDLDDV